MSKITLECELCMWKDTHYKSFFHEVGGTQFKVNNNYHHICDCCCKRYGDLTINFIVQELKKKYEEKEGVLKQNEL